MTIGNLLTKKSFQVYYTISKEKSQQRSRKLAKKSELFQMLKEERKTRGQQM